MKLPDFLTEWPFGEIVLTGHRIGLYDIIYFHKEGYSAEMLHEQFPSVPLDHIEKVLAFARENHAEVDAYVDRFQKEIDHLRATTPRLLDWDELRRKFESMKQAEQN
jgi:uncharacterized protein (DUF433 family)